MISLTLQEAAAAVHGTLRGVDRRFSGVSTDTRTLLAGELFVALKGARFDGHDCLSEAAHKGAAGAVVSRDSGPVPASITVPDTRRALGELAHGWRLRHHCPVIGITGSNGKTTTKEMTAAILGQRGPVLATRGNLNNHIGLPLTLCRLAAEHRAAVLEMGANALRDIAELAAIAVPTIGVVTMCGPAHLAGFGSLENVALAKGRLFEGLPSEGTAILNADDRFADVWRGMCGTRRLVTFGLGEGVDYGASEIKPGLPGAGVSFVLRTPHGSAVVSLPLDGVHNVHNALAAAAASMTAGATLQDVVTGLGCMKPVQGRLISRPGCAGSHLIDDTYNANPASLRAALEVLARAGGRRWLILGDMGELGPEELEIHRAAGREARRCGVDRLFAVGERSHGTAEAFGPGAIHYPDLETLVDAVKPQLAPDVTVLIKGSRFMQLEQVVGALLAVEDSRC